MKGLTPVCDEDLQNSPFNVQIYNSEVIVHVVFQVSAWCCLFFTRRTNSWLARARRSLRHRASLRWLIYSTLKVMRSTCGKSKVIGEGKESSDVHQLTSYFDSSPRYLRLTKTFTLGDK